MKLCGVCGLALLAGCANGTQNTPTTPHVAAQVPGKTAKPVLTVQAVQDKGEVRDVQFSPDGRLLAIGTLWNDVGKISGFVTLRNTQTDSVIKKWQVPDGVKSVAFSPDGKRLATGRYKGVSVWEVPSGRLLYQQKIEEGDAFRVTCAFTPDGKTLAVGCGGLLMLDATNWKPKQTPIKIGTPGFVDSVQFSPDGRYLVTTHHDQGISVNVWDTRTGQGRSFAKGDGGTIAFSRDSRLIAIKSGYDAPIGDTIIWNIKNKRRVAKVDNTYAYPLSFSADGTKIVCLQGNDRFLTVWDARTGAFLKTSGCHDVLALSPDGKQVATTSWGGEKSIQIEPVDVKLF